MAPPAQYCGHVEGGFSCVMVHAYTRCMCPGALQSSALHALSTCTCHARLQPLNVLNVCVDAQVRERNFRWRELLVVRVCRVMCAGAAGPGMSL